MPELQCYQLNRSAASILYQYTPQASYWYWRPQTNGMVESPGRPYEEWKKRQMKNTRFNQGAGEFLVSSRTHLYKERGWAGKRQNAQDQRKGNMKSGNHHPLM